MTKFSPETVAFSEREVDDLCVMEDYKVFNGLIVSIDEGSKAQGVDHSYGENGLYIDIGDTSHILLHVIEMLGPQQVRRELVQAATYINLHPEYREYKTVMGVTYQQLGNFAVRRLGFRAIQPSAVEPVTLGALSDLYGFLPLSKNAPLSPQIVYMPVDEFIDRYAAKYLGTDADYLLDRIEADEPLPQPLPELVSSDDAVIAAIQHVTDTM